MQTYLAVEIVYNDNDHNAHMLMLFNQALFTRKKTQHRHRTSQQHSPVQHQEKAEISKQVNAAAVVETDGFTGVKRNRVNTKAFFLSGISNKVNPKQIHDYLVEREICPTLLKVFPSKRKGTVSAKLNVKSKDAVGVLKPDFWPKFVRCRAWVTQNKLKKDGLQVGFRAVDAACVDSTLQK